MTYEVIKLFVQLLSVKEKISLGETLPMVGTDAFNIKVINSTCTPTPYSTDTTYI